MQNDELSTTLRKRSSEFIFAVDTCKQLAKLVASTGKVLECDDTFVDEDMNDI